MTVGNAVINGARHGLQKNLVNNMTGHVTLVSGKEETYSVLFTEKVLPLQLIVDYPRLKGLLENQEIVESFLPVSRGHAIVIADGSIPLSEEGAEDAILLLGFEFKDSEFGFLLINDHLQFIIRFGRIGLNLIIILCIAFITAYFPSRKAANLAVAEALRYYE